MKQKKRRMLSLSGVVVSLFLNAVHYLLLTYNKRSKLIIIVNKKKCDDDEEMNDDIARRGRILYFGNGVLTPGTSWISPYQFRKVRLFDEHLYSDCHTIGST